ncbi:hypothetical protein BHC53_08445 [Snodgrassella alvi]|nr:hypothetical protein BHC53_08445 [Snodgrassella alvi]
MVVGTAVLVASFIQQVGSGIVLQGFPVGLVAAAFDAAGAVIVVIGLSLPGMFFTHQPVEVVVLVAAVGEDVGQDGVVATPGLFVLQAAVAVVFEFGVRLSLATQDFAM